MMASVRGIVESDRSEWLRMRHALWPGSLADHDAETRAHFAPGAETPVVLVAESAGQVVGFLELDYRKYAVVCFRKSLSVSVTPR